MNILWQLIYTLFIPTIYLLDSQLYVSNIKNLMKQLLWYVSWMSQSTLNVSSRPFYWLSWKNFQQTELNSDNTDIFLSTVHAQTTNLPNCNSRSMFMYLSSNEQSDVVTPWWLLTGLSSPCSTSDTVKAETKILILISYIHNCACRSKPTEKHHQQGVTITLTQSRWGR